MNLRDLIPSSNRIEAAFASRNGGQRCRVLEASYAGGFVGSFLVNRSNIQASMETEGWVRRAGEYLRDEFLAEREKDRTRFLSDISGSLQAADLGGCYMNHKAALTLWLENGKLSVMPFSCEQGYGSCVDASLSELLTAILGIRIVVLKKAETWKHPAAWWAYSLRGYCSDGWNAWGAASAIAKLGVAFRMLYELSKSYDLRDDDANEQLVARTWCRSGPPEELRSLTKREHPIDPSKIVEFDGGIEELCTVFANLGVLHFSGTRVSGGPKPMTPGRVGPHQMPAYGCDGSEEIRRHLRDKCGVSLADDDVAVHCGNTWGERTGQWSGECADQYWPPHWGPKTPGSWICSGKWFLRELSQDMVYFPEAFPGFPGSPLPPSPNTPAITGAIYADPLPSGLIAIRGEMELDLPAGLSAGKHKYIVMPDGAGRYKPVPKPSL